MSDHTDDGFPRERYEGPMASLPGTLSVPLSPYIKPALGHGASGLPKENATGHDGCIRGLEKANATIAEQAAEIERLKGEYAELKEIHGKAILARDDALIERDTLRLEVDRQQNLNFEAQDRYAALEAERDELKRKLDEAEKEIAHMRESNGRADDYSAKLERVIEAANVNAGAMVNLLIAMAKAGLPMPGPAPLPPGDAKS